MKFDWDAVWGIVLLIFIVGGLIVLATFIVTEKHVDGYYLSRGTSDRAASVCVWAHWTWHNDEIVFCTDDYQRAIDFITKASATVTKK